MFVVSDGGRFGLRAKSIASFSFVCTFKLTPSSLDSHSSRIMSSSSRSEWSSACELLCKMDKKHRENPKDINTIKYLNKYDRFAYPISFIEYRTTMIGYEVNECGNELKKIL